MIAKDLFSLIRGNSSELTVSGENGEGTDDESKMRYFNFDYADSAGSDIGNVTVALRPSKLMVYYDRTIGDEIPEEEKAGWTRFLRSLRKFATQHVLGFMVKDISKSLDSEPAVVKHLASTQRKHRVSESALTIKRESSAPGMTLRIQVSTLINERTGNQQRIIESIDIEDSRGRSIRCPFTNLPGARALARHIYSGGKAGDEFGAHITALVNEMADLRQFAQFARSKLIEHTSSTSALRCAIERRDQIKETLNRMKGEQGYALYRKNYKTAVTLQDDIELEEMRTNFLNKKLNESANR